MFFCDTRVGTVLLHCQQFCGSRIRMLLGLLNLDSDSLVRGTDLSPDPSNMKQKK